MNENNQYNEAPNPPLEFKVIDLKANGFAGLAWFHGKTKLGAGEEELESILNRFGNEGWDVIQMTPTRLLLRRKAR